jgi:signal transduction histidine kinase
VGLVQHGHLSEFVAASLAAHASHLAQHWLERALAATPRSPAPLGGAAAGAPGPGAPAPGAPAPGAPASTAHGVAGDAAAVAERAEQVVRALAASVLSSTAASLVMAGDHTAARRVLASGGGTGAGGAPGPDARPAGEMMRLGWSAGAAAFAAGHSVHHVVRDADLLLAVVLADVERAVADVPPGPGATAADALAVARRLHRATGRYAQAAVSGFVHALLRGLRERYRLLRHDLRNPLGTIRSALSLMEDESVPVETRQGPNIRAMVARNAGSLDRLISRRLDDAAATALLAPPHEVRLRDVAQAARREVREAARLAGAEIVVDVRGDAPLHVDGAALELTLTTVLLSALARAAPGATVRVSCADHAPRPDPTPGALPGAPCGGADEDCVCVVMRVDIEPPGPAFIDPAFTGASSTGASSTGASSTGAPGGGAAANGTAGQSSRDRADTDADMALPRWDAHGLGLAIALAGDHGGRLGVAADVPATRDAEALVAALAYAPSIFLRLPLMEVGPSAGTRPTDGATAAPDTALPAVPAVPAPTVRT